jgi:hypothetical protein
MVGAMLTGWPIQQQAPPALYTLAIAFAGYALLTFPIVFYRPASAQLPRTEN